MDYDLGYFDLDTCVLKPTRQSVLPQVVTIGPSFHARFGLGEDPWQPYKKTIDRWLWPDIFRGPEASVARAKEAIIDYNSAVGDPRARLSSFLNIPDRVQSIGRQLGYGVGEDMDVLLAEVD